MSRQYVAFLLIKEFYEDNFMKRFSIGSVLIVFILFIIAGCGGKTTSLEGKVVDGKGKPLSGVKVVAKISQPVKGHEQSETTAGSDGTFKLKNVLPSSEYQLVFYSGQWKTEKKMLVKSGPAGQTKTLAEPMMIRFMDVKEGIVLDTKTDLMWAAKDNGSPVNWPGAVSYCENYRAGGHADWRMPAQNELAELYAAKEHRDIIQISGCCVWASETRGSRAVNFSFNDGIASLNLQSNDIYAGGRALPVRSGK